MLRNNLLRGTQRLTIPEALPQYFLANEGFFQKWRYRNIDHSGFLKIFENPFRFRNRPSTNFFFHTIDKTNPIYRTRLNKILLHATNRNRYFNTIFLGDIESTSGRIVSVSREERCIPDQQSFSKILEG